MHTTQSRRFSIKRITVSRIFKRSSFPHSSEPYRCSRCDLTLFRSFSRKLADESRLLPQHLHSFVPGASWFSRQRANPFTFATKAYLCTARNLVPDVPLRSRNFRAQIDTVVTVRTRSFLFRGTSDFRRKGTQMFVYTLHCRNSKEDDSDLLLSKRQ